MAARTRARSLGLLLAIVLGRPAAATDAAHDSYIDDYRLHMECSGRGAPTVVLDAGLGGSSLEWVFVVERLRRLTQVCTWDRAGYGGSDMGPLPRTSGRIAAELERLLRAERLPPPYVLVGHSFGGYNMQIFARQHPELTAGLALIDASHPEQVERFEAPPLNLVTAPTSRAGVVQFRDQPPANLALPPRLRLAIEAEAHRWKARRTLSAELLSFRDSAAEVRAAPPLGRTPLVVISRGRLAGEMNERRRLFEGLWLTLQSELAASSAVSAHLVALHSGHQVHVEQPALVAYGIAMLVLRARGADGTKALAAARAQDFSLEDAVWLKDDLSVDAPAVLAVAPTQDCAAPCGQVRSGAP